jgi:hypothetical protein
MNRQEYSPLPGPQSHQMFNAYGGMLPNSYNRLNDYTQSKHEIVLEIL